MRRALVVLGVIVMSAIAGPALAVPRPDAQGQQPFAASQSQVPWSRVGTGWTLASWTRRHRATETLYLVSSTGRRYAVARMPKSSYPLLWSPDGRRALMGGDHGLSEVDLRTGRRTAVHLPGGYTEPLTYSRPRGLALIAAVGTTEPGTSYITMRLERFGLNGRHQLSYPLRVKGAGTLSTSGVVETADGTELVVGAHHGLVLLRNDGTLVRRLLPSTRQTCEVVTWWRHDIALASCGGRMWAVPISGAKATALSLGPTRKDMFGYVNEWRYSRGRLGLAANGCGPATLVRFDKRGQGVPIDVPSPTGRQGKPIYVGHFRDLVTMEFTADSCESEYGTALLAYNARTGHSKALLGPGANGGTVTDALPFRTDY
ncbi:MAG TPA: hypothetical protein VFT67_11890 [Jatrophihabitantaceae bacterium]|nr:hypothetical protein [Jatrophihabitantaceae bacterium]